MATPTVLDFEQLLAPISDDQPTGVALKDDAAGSAEYYRVKDAREAARTAEREIARARLLDDEDEHVHVSPPDWRVVEELAAQVLKERSKDLWVVAWLIEALTRRYGFAGVRDGFRLAREMCERFWDGIHPRPDEDGDATTVAQLAGLNGQEAEGALIAPLAAIVITEVGPDDLPPLTGADHADASDLEQLADRERRTQRVDQGAITLDMFERAARASSAEFFLNLLEDIDEALEQFRQLNVVLQEKCSQTSDGYSLAPPSSSIENAVKLARERVVGISRAVIPSVNTDESEGADEEGVESGASDGVSTKGQVQTREDAFRALLQVADFFRRTEPHSPLSYALEQVVRWGRMSLPELLKELINDESARTEMSRRTGIPFSDGENG